MYKEVQKEGRENTVILRTYSSQSMVGYFVSLCQTMEVRLYDYTLNKLTLGKINNLSKTNE